MSICTHLPPGPPARVTSSQNQCLAKYNLEATIATMRAAEAKRSPAMILLIPWALRYASTSLVAACTDAARTASVPITLHLNHAQDPAMIRRAADTGQFDSIMVDMSHHEREQNL